MYLDKFPIELRELAHELYAEAHPTLHKILKEHNCTDVDSALPHIATHCEVLVEGKYTVGDRLNLIKRLLPILESKRGM